MSEQLPNAPRRYPRQREGEEMVNAKPRPKFEKKRGQRPDTRPHKDSDRDYRNIAVAACGFRGARSGANVYDPRKNPRGTVERPADTVERTLHELRHDAEVRDRQAGK